MFGDFRGYDNQGENKKIQERVKELAGAMVEAYQSSSSAEDVARRYEELIREAGFQLLGRGQNRVAFRVEGSDWVYKVPFREVGFRDNAIERYCSSLVSNTPQAYKELAAHMPMVSNFSLGKGYENFMICAEYVKNLVSKNGGVFLKDDRDAAIFAAVEHFREVSAILRKFNDYFHMNDVHLVLSAENFGVKKGSIAIRDLGYFVPRIGEFQSVTVPRGNKDVQIGYYTLDNIALTAEEAEDTGKRIDRLSEVVESWAPYDENGKLLVTNERDLLDASNCIQPLLKQFEENYL